MGATPHRCRRIAPMGCSYRPETDETTRMSEKKAYPLRINADVIAAAQRWADDELRSLNAQIEYVLRDALRKAGRLPKSNEPKTEEPKS